MKNDTDSLKFIFKELADRAHRLNDWEIGFLGNVEDQFLKTGSITDAQDETLNQIYEKATENG